MTKNLLAGKYEIVRELGRGGMGTVYLAYDLQIKRKVAVKLIHDTTPMAMKRFAREARAIAQLKHPNIVRVYEYVKYKNTTCMIMQYIEGMTLDKYLQAHSLTLREKIELFLKIVHAVDYAHERSIIHRDLKPRNILIDQQQTPYLLDFGLAKVIDGIDRSITQTGQIVGTPRYMSPEQARGDVSTLSRPSDIYSLGAIFYEIITQQPVVSKSSTIQILLEIIEHPIIMPRKVDKNIPIVLENICLKALQKQAKYRYKTAKLFADDLHRYLENKTVTTYSLYRKYIPRTLIALVLLCSFLLYIFKIQKPLLPKVTIHINELQEAQNWLKRGHYQQAQKSFRKAYENKLLSQQDFLMYMTTISSFIGNRDDFISYYENLNIPLRESLSMQLANARMLYKERDFEQAHTIFSSLWKEGNAQQKSCAGYYLARILLLQRKYGKALDFFKAIKAMNAVFVEQEHTDFFMGKCCFLLKKLSKARSYFQQEIKKDPYFVKSYFYLGKIKLAFKDYSGAQESLEQCIRLDSTNSYHFSELGKAFFAQKKYLEASKSFAKAKELNHENMEAFEGFTKVAYADVRFLRGRYVQIMREIDEYRYDPPDLLRSQFVFLANQYRHNYLQQQKVLDAKGNILPLIEKLFSKDPHLVENAYNALWVMRYHPDLDKAFSRERFRALNKIYTKITTARATEEQHSVYYQLTQLYLQPRTIVYIAEKKLIAILQNSNEQSIFRYLAAKALLSKSLFSTVVNIYKKGDNAQRIICLSALKDIGLGVAKSMPLSIPQDSFLLLIFAKNCFLENSVQITRLLNHDKAFISLNIANKYFASRRPECQEILRKWMHHKDVNIRANAYYFFWKQFSQKENFTFSSATLRKIWQEGINDQEEVQKALLQSAATLKFPYLKTSIRELLQKTSDISIHILAIKAFSKLESPRDLIVYYANKMNIDVLRAFAAQKHAIDTFTIVTQYLQRDQKKGLLWLAQKVIPLRTNFLIEQPNELLKSYGYALDSMMSKNMIPFVKREKNLNMKAVLLTLLTVGTGALNKKINILGTPQRQASREEKIEIAKKYLRHPHQNVKTAAYYSYVFMSDRAIRRNVFFETRRKNDASLKRTVAHALFYLVQNKIDTQDATMFTKYFLTEINAEQRVWANVSMAKKYFQDVKHRREIKELLQQIITLDSSVAQYHYYMFLLLSVEKDQKASSYLKKAYDLDKNNPVFLLGMFHLTKDDSFLQHMYKYGKSATPEILSSLCHESGNKIVEKILLQNYYFFVINRRSSSYRIAWKNLLSFYGAKQFLSYDAR
ncbi:serine/threonine-protein kinase [Candidatus Uabimicrobium amorphum]|uniref:Protein kinase n=1 Tax=Uabimicrobium amorphum TaxID=2596890 RepID=A0A5S9INV3_UABAM|nr:serine/threonine-protein kinase [Candidatus Uabimicrobium amorphum]BBM84957.1 protein kinase [Candidatus Uabimicrobium amorphum]